MDKVCKVCSQWHYMHNKKKPNLYYMQTREEAVIRIIKWKIHVVSPFDICGVFLTKHPPPKKKKKKKRISVEAFGLVLFPTFCVLSSCPVYFSFDSLCHLESYMRSLLMEFDVLLMGT